VCRGHEVQVHSVAFSPRGGRLGSMSIDGTVKIWDGATGQETLSWRDVSASTASALAFSPDGQRLAVTSGQEGHIRTLADGRLARALRGHFMSVFGLAYSPDGRRLATVSWDNTAKLWDPHTGREVLAFRGHTDAVRGVAFSPDGRHLATASHDRTIRVWYATGAAEVAAGLVRTVRVSL